MYNNVMNRGLFRRYARQPQAPQAPSGIMASSPELMQTAMRYQQGGMVQPPVAQPRVNPQFRPDLMRFADGTGPQGIQVDPTLRGSRAARRSQPSVNVTEQVDISQAPTEFKMATEEQIAENPLAAYSNMGAAMGAKAVEEQGKKAEVTEVDEAIKTGDAAMTGETPVDPANVPDPLKPVVDKLADPKATENEKAGAMLGALGKDAPKGTKGKIQALKDTISEVFGVDASRYDSLKALNRAMVGFSIARGDDIADALAKGVQGAAAIEEKQIAREDAMSKMALEQAFAEKLAAMRASGSGATGGANKFRNPINAYQDAYSNALRQAQDPIVAARIREGGQTIEQWADGQARGVVQGSYTASQLAGTQFAPAAPAPKQPTGEVDITTPTATGGSQYKVGQTITNKETGEKLQWDGSSWQPMK